MNYTSILICLFIFIGLGNKSYQEKLMKLNIKDNVQPFEYLDSLDNVCFKNNTLIDGIYSPLKKMTHIKDRDTIMVKYGSPNLSGKTIKQKISYGIKWRTGANDATMIYSSFDFQFGNDTIPGGRSYTLFTIPNKDKWEVILSSRINLWGTQVDSIKTHTFVGRAKFEPRVGESLQEALTFEHNCNDTLLLKWGNLELPIPIVKIN